VKIERETLDHLPVTHVGKRADCRPVIPLYTGHIYAAAMDEIDEPAYKFIKCVQIINGLNWGGYRCPDFLWLAISTTIFLSNRF
jgi:hypothetical protein